MCGTKPTSASFPQYNVCQQQRNKSCFSVEISTIANILVSGPSVLGGISTNVPLCFTLIHLIMILICLWLWMLSFEFFLNYVKLDFLKIVFKCQIKLTLKLICLVTNLYRDVNHNKCQLLECYDFICHIQGLTLSSVNDKEASLAKYVLD